MTFEITFIDCDRRLRDGKIWDVIDYRFQVSNGQLSRIVAVGITGQYHDPAGPLGLKELSRRELTQAAEAWLRSRLDKGQLDPFGRPGTDSSIDVPPGVMDYWIERRSIPP